MAIMLCPGCSQRISSKLESCPSCNFDLSDIDPDRQKELRRRELLDSIYHMKMLSYAALTVLIVAFGWYLKETSWFQHRSGTGPYVLFSVGAVAYMVIRGFLLKFKAALRKLNSG